MQLTRIKSGRQVFLFTIPDSIYSQEWSEIPLNPPLVEKRSRGRLFAKGGVERWRLDTARF